MRRRDVLISLGGASMGGAIAATPVSAQTEAANAAVPPIGPYAEPWNPPDPEVPARRNIAKMPDDYFTPGRFAGKTVLVTGCARGMGAGAAWRLAREGANVVGVDWLEAEGQATMDAIAAEGHATRFVPGDVGEDATCARMIEAALEAFGGIDAALNNAGVMDGVYSGEPVDYAAQKDLVFAPIHEATEAYWDAVFRTNVKGVFLSMRHELRQMLAQGRGGSIPHRACREPRLRGVETRRERHHEERSRRLRALRNSRELGQHGRDRHADGRPRRRARRRAERGGRPRSGDGPDQDAVAPRLHRPEPPPRHRRGAGLHDVLPAQSRVREHDRRHLRDRRRLDRLLTSREPGEPPWTAETC